MERLVYEFLDHAKRKKFKENTVNDYNYTIMTFVKFLRKNYPDTRDITDVSRDIIVSYEKYLVVMKDSRGKVLSRNRRRRYLANLKIFYRYLEKEEKIIINPTSNIAMPGEKKSILKDILTVEEMDILLKSCSDDSIKTVRDRAILELLYSTGIRSDELCNILIEDIDFSGNILFVRKGKMGNERLIPFGTSANYWVRKYIEKVRPLINGPGRDFLFVSMNGNMLKPQALLDLIKKWTFVSGIKKNVTAHTFRHTCASHMLKGNADIRYVQKQLGHKRLSTTEKYLRVEITDLKEVHERTHPREQDSW